MARSLSVLLLIAATISVASCQPSLVAKLGLPAHFSGFASLLNQSGLVPNLQAFLNQGGSVTIFALTDNTLIFGTSPALLASLQQPGKLDPLRQLLISHIVPQEVTNSSWQGIYRTLLGSNLTLTAGNNGALFAGGDPVTQYNAVTGDSVTVHAVSSLVFPDQAARLQSVLNGSSAGLVDTPAPFPPVPPSQPSPDSPAQPPLDTRPQPPPDSPAQPPLDTRPQPPPNPPSQPPIDTRPQPPPNPPSQPPPTPPSQPPPSPPSQPPPTPPSQPPPNSPSQPPPTSTSPPPPAAQEGGGGNALPAQPAPNSGAATRVVSLFCGLIVSTASLAFAL